MNNEHQQERREFFRVKLEVPVRYKFLSKFRQAPALTTIHEGATSNISAGGLFLVGHIPDLTWIPDLLMQKMVIGLNLLLPTSEVPIKALARVAWLETLDEATQKCGMGLKFKEISAEDKDKIFQFVIKSQMPS